MSSVADAILGPTVTNSAHADDKVFIHSGHDVVKTPEP